MIKLFSCLAFAGVLPFLMCFILLMFGVVELPLLGKTEKVLSVYGLVILSFMAGSHWGLHLNVSNKWRFYLPVLSNIIAVLAWVAFLGLSFSGLMIQFAITFLVLLLIDQQLQKEQVISRSYYLTRCGVTAVVILLLLLSALVA